MNRTLRWLAASVFCAVVVSGQDTRIPVISINRPGVNGNAFINVPVNAFSEHSFAVYDRASANEATGFLLERLLAAAGWGRVADNKMSEYVVRVSGRGGDTAVFPLAEIGRRSLENRVWLVTKQERAPLPEADGPLLVSIGSDEAVMVKIRRVQQVRVANKAEQPQAEDGDFGRLSKYGARGGVRILSETYARVDGVPVLVEAWSASGKRDMSAVLLSEHASRWNDTQLLSFLSNRVGVLLGPNAAIMRGDGFVVVSFSRLPVAVR